MINLSQEILQADDVEIEKLLKAVRQRYAELFPNWEVVVISIEKNTNRNEQLDGMIAMLQNMKISD